jgi:ectoine hydroxylase-related dioxygenase (phytanoyl-CoA dioxygenase family)
MPETQFSLADLEARNIALDCDRIGGRIEAYRMREPSEHPDLIIDGQRETRAEPCIPEVDAGDFTVERLREAVVEHGSLIVRNLFDRASMDKLIPIVDRVVDACAGGSGPTASAYYNPPDNLRTIMPNRDRELGNTRNFHRESGSAMCVEAPSVAEMLLQWYEAHGLKKLVTEYLGEAPCLTVKKWVLRRSLLPVAEAGWHQDGAFMGTNINSINMWIPLNECGGETGAPGMDVVPLRLNRIASSEGAQFDWSVSDAQATDASKPLIPEFNEGDAFFFDHYFLHRTQYRTDFTKVRYAIETWFFGESSFPKNQIPLAW